MWLAPNTTYSNLQKWDNFINFQYLETPEELSTYVHNDSKIVNSARKVEYYLL